MSYVVIFYPTKKQLLWWVLFNQSFWIKTMVFIVSDLLFFQYFLLNNFYLGLVWMNSGRKYFGFYFGWKSLRLNLYSFVLESMGLKKVCLGSILNPPNLIDYSPQNGYEAMTNSWNLRRMSCPLLLVYKTGLFFGS